MSSLRTPRRSSGGVLMTLAWCLACGAIGGTATAQPATPEVGKGPSIPDTVPKPARMADGHPNFTGFWTRPGGLLEVYRGPSGVTNLPTQGAPAAPGSGNGGAPPAPHSPLKEPYKSRYAAQLKNVAAGKVVDPVALCLPAGMPRMMGGIYGIEILQTPGQITITSEWQAESRRIWMNDKKQPPMDEVELSYGGHSIGHWEGDTLVVDTIGVRADVPMDGSGLPHSDKIHFTERFAMKGRQLIDDLTVEDPDTYEAPWKLSYNYRFRPDLRLEEYVCEENNRNVGPHGEAVFDK